jgi:hypothetical protein
MQRNPLRLSEHDIESRLAQLSPAQAEALESALSAAGGSALDRVGGEDLPYFLLPLAEAGLSGIQIRTLMEKVPSGFPLDHREIYFDFRLGMWIRHLEPPTVSGILEEYLATAETPEQGLAYLKGEWRGFLRRHGFASEGDVPLGG